MIKDNQYDSNVRSSPTDIAQWTASMLQSPWTPLLISRIIFTYYEYLRTLLFVLSLQFLFTQLE